MNRALLLRFIASAAVGAVIAVGTAVLTTGPQIVSTANAGAPVSIIDGNGNPLDFGLQPGQPKALGPLPATATIQLAAFHAAGPSSAPGGAVVQPWWNSSSPRIPAITQFDGGPLAAVNCLMAAGAMLSRLGYGIVTTGSQMRALQDDQEDGTNYQNLQNAVRQGWGVRFFSGALTPLQLRALLYAGAGAVIDGVYGELPVDIRLQKDFTGRHAVYVDGFRAPGPAGPAAYYVMDPIGHSWEGYKGAWWPAEDVERFAAQLTGNLINTLWAFPGGAVPKNHPILPPNAYPHGPGHTPGPGESPPASPGASAGADPMPDGDLPLTVDPPSGDPPGEVPHPKSFDFRTDVFEVMNPGVDGCLVQPSPKGCPRGIVGIIDLNGLIGPPATAPPRDRIDLLYATAIAPDTYQVLFEPPPDTKGDLWFWGSDGTMLQAATVESGTLGGKSVSIATITLEPGATYSFVATASGDGVRASSTVGSLQVGS